MKIATMVRGYISAPCPTDIIYAPIELAIHISEGLARQGHEVTFYGPEGTRLAAQVQTLGLRPLARNLREFQDLIHEVELMVHNQPGLWDQYMVQDMFERARAGEYDLLHFHHFDAAIAYARLYPDVPVTYTLHDPIANWSRELLDMYDTPNQFPISISNNQRRAAPDLSYAATIYNGIDTDLFAFSDSHDDYLLFASRIVPDKGAREAVQLARETNQRLLLIGPIYPETQAYFDQHVKPFLNEKIIYLGLVEREHLIKYYQKAKALLFPLQWEEPFGLTMTEAMSCGTPVIALRRGSVAEVVHHGRTGFIADSLAGMVEAINTIDTIRRQDCRDHVVRHFSMDTMINNYAATFENVLREHKPTASRAVGAGSTASGPASAHIRPGVTPATLPTTRK